MAERRAHHACSHAHSRSAWVTFSGSSAPACEISSALYRGTPVRIFTNSYTAKTSACTRVASTAPLAMNLGGGSDIPASST